MTTLGMRAKKKVCNFCSKESYHASFFDTSVWSGLASCLDLCSAGATCENSWNCRLLGGAKQQAGKSVCFRRLLLMLPFQIFINGLTWVSGPKGRGRGRGRGSKAKKRGKTDSGYKWPNARRLTQSTPDDRQELSNIFKSFSKWCGFFYFWYFVNNCVCLHSESVVSGIGAKYAHVDCLNRLCIKNYLRNPSGNAVKPKKCFWPSRNDCT